MTNVCLFISPLVCFGSVVIITIFTNHLFSTPEMDMSKLLSELSPMRDTQYWHNYLNQLLSPGQCHPSQQSWPRKPPPPLIKPKPRMIRVSFP